MIQCLKPAEYCAEYPILSYKLLLRSEQTGKSNEVSINYTEDDIVSDSIVVLTDGGLESNQKYYYSVAAVNSVGMATSHQLGNWTYFGMCATLT